MGVYVALPSLRNLPGKIVLSNVIAVTAATIMILINYNVVSLKVEQTSCKIVGHLVYYFGIAMFTWMTIMCFDLCTIFLKDMATPHKGILAFETFDFKWHVRNFIFVRKFIRTSL